MGVGQANSQEPVQHDRCHGVQPELKIPAYPQAPGYAHSLANVGVHGRKSTGGEPELGVRRGSKSAVGSKKKKKERESLLRF